MGITLNAFPKGWMDGAKIYGSIANIKLLGCKTIDSLGYSIKRFHFLIGFD